MAAVASPRCSARPGWSRPTRAAAADPPRPWPGSPTAGALRRRATAHGALDPALGYAALPWVAAGGAAAAPGRPRRACPAGARHGARALTPTGHPAGGRGGRRRRPRQLAPDGSAGAVRRRWPRAALAGRRARSHPGGRRRARAAWPPSPPAPRTGRARSGAVLGTGGIWNADAVPTSRGLALSPLVTVALVALAALGWADVAACRARTARTGRGWACWPPWPGRRPAWPASSTRQSATMPGAGLLRDGQKWAHGGRWCSRSARARAPGAARRAAPVGRAGSTCAARPWSWPLLLPVFAVPDLAWGVGGRLRPVAFPDDWDARRGDRGRRDPRPARCCCCPSPPSVRSAGTTARPSSTRHPASSRARPSATTRSSSAPRRSTATMDDPGSRCSRPRTTRPRWRRTASGWVLVEHGTPGPPVPARIAAAPPVFTGSWLDLLRVPGERGPRRT